MSRGEIEPHVLKLFWGMATIFEKTHWINSVFLNGITSILHSTKPFFLRKVPKSRKRYGVFYFSRGQP